jgi:hypothetical protein
MSRDDKKKRLAGTLSFDAGRGRAPGNGPPFV